MSLSRGVFCLSLDFELVWGSRDLVRDPAGLLRAARITRERVFPGLLELLRERELPATWATVGHLYLEGARADAEGRLHPELIPPKHAWLRSAWLAGVPAGHEGDHPEYYGASLVRRLLEAGHEVGAHGFTHAIFGDPGCSREAARSELAHIVAAAEALGFRPRSFVFPRNLPGHLELLAEAGFTCWRPPEGGWHSSPRLPHSAQRLGHLAQVVRAATPVTALPRRGAHGMVEIPASATFLPLHGVRRAVPLSRRITRCVRGLEAAAEARRVMHLYTHPINLAADPEPMLAAFGEVFDHAVRLRDQGRLDCLTMGQLAEAVP